MIVSDLLKDVEHAPSLTEHLYDLVTCKSPAGTCDRDG